MTDKEILSNAIDKAIANGWEPYGNIRYTKSLHLDSHWIRGQLFSHSFAEAFWGKKKDYFEFDENGYVHNTPAYIFHLMQMVRKENPLTYLEKYL